MIDNVYAVICTYIGYGSDDNVDDFGDEEAEPGNNNFLT